eukprot:m51a1_g13513 hypothetical protein (236) ;mRNA; r:22-1071
MPVPVPVHEHSSAAAGGAGCPLLRGLRVRLLASLVLAVAVAVAAAVVAVDHVAGAELRGLERRQAVEEATLFYGALNFQLEALRRQIQPTANWDAVYYYLAAGDPDGFVFTLLSVYLDFLEVNDLEATLLFLPNGTMLNGFMWDATRTRKVRASETLARQVGAQLSATGTCSGLFWIPETGTAVAVSSQYSRRTDYSGADVGWLVWVRNVHSLLRPIAEMASLCLSFVDWPACEG